MVLVLAVCTAELPAIVPDAPIDVRAFGAAADGKTDATAAFAQALSAAAARGGGTVTVPAGLFLIAGSVSVPTGVTLQGTWAGPHHGAWKQGSTLCLTGGRGKEDGPAAIQMGASSAVRGLTIVHPEQTLDDVQPYPWAIRGGGMHCTVENVTLVNSFQGIAMGPGSNELHLIRNVFGCVLRRGVLIDGTTDIGRIENVHFNPHYWMRAEFPGTPGVWRVPGADGKTETRHPQWYMQEHLDAFIFGRTDWEYVLNTFVFGAKVGYLFTETRAGMANGNFLGIGADWCTTCVKVEASQPMGILVTNGEFVGHHGCESAIEVEGKGVLQLCNSNFWGFQKRNVRLRGEDAFVSLNQCIFRDWGPVPEDAAVVEASGGALTVQGCAFMRPRRHIALGEKVKSAVIFGNTFTGAPAIENAAKGDVKIDLNASYVPAKAK
jgi:hypothetical protein